MIIKLKVLNADTSVNCYLSTVQSHRPNLSEVIANFMFCFNVFLRVFIILLTKWTVIPPLLLVYVVSFI